MRRPVPLLLCLALLAGCGGGGNGSSDGEETPASASPSAAAIDATCTAEGPNLKVVAKNNQFDRDCLAAPANAEVKIELVNQDTFAHNLSIYKKEGGESIFLGAYVQGGETQNYTVPPQPAQRAYFVCDIHPQMAGVFIFE
jgi:plastocyanin